MLKSSLRILRGAMMVGVVLALAVTWRASGAALRPALPVTLSAAQAKVQIHAEEPTARIGYCHRRTARKITCRVFVLIEGRKETIDPATGEVIEIEDFEAGWFPMNAAVGLWGVKWSIPPQLTEG